MYLNSVTGNVINKFNNQKINILYQPQKNLFDVLLGYCGYDLFIDQSNEFIQTDKNNMVLVNNETANLYNYNVGITNNIMQYASQKIFINLHLNTIIFTHSYRPSNIKKEDLLLMSNNLSRECKVFFADDVAETWSLFTNKVIMKYGIPTDILYPDSDIEKLDSILILNFENSKNVEALADLLESNGIKVNLIKTITGDLNAVRELFNRYKMVIDFSEHNIINLLCAISCGCKAISYGGDMIVNNYSDVPNLYMAKSVQDVLEIVKVSQSKDPIPATEFINTNFEFELFKTKISNLVSKLNNEAFIL